MGVEEEDEMWSLTEDEADERLVECVGDTGLEAGAGRSSGAGPGGCVLLRGEGSTLGEARMDSAMLSAW